MAKNLILYVLLIVYLLLSVFVFGNLNIPLYNEVVNPLLWIIICGVAIYLSKDDSFRIKDERNKTQCLIIALIMYIIFYFLLGLVFGFQKTPYAKDIGSILKNLWSFGGIIFFQEIVRNAMIRLEQKKPVNLIIITILFILVNMSLITIGNNYINIKEGFTYTTSILIPLIVTNVVLTYLSYIGGAKLPIIYRLFMTVPGFIIPILPDLDWFLTAVIGITVPLAIFIYLNYVHANKSQRLSKRERRKYNPKGYIPIFVIIGLAVAFVIGAFKYQPIAVLSGSMSPTFNRGDAVIVKKLNTKEKDELQKGDVIQFTSGSKYVIHRIFEISNDQYGNKTFITKGDANNTKDAGSVNAEQVIGKAACVIPYIGYPSVWLSGLIS